MPEPATPYTLRQPEDSNVGRSPYGGCACQVLQAIYDDETVDGWTVRHMLCPSCAAGWVREMAWDDTDASSSAAPRSGSESPE